MNMWCDDITFCQEECERMDCPRNQHNIRDRRVPHSFSVEIPQDCPKKQEGKKSKIPDMKKVIKDLTDIGGWNAGRVGFERARNFMRTIDDAVAMLKKQDELLHKKQKDIDRLCNEISELKHKFHDISLKKQEAEWIYSEDETGADGWHCSYCGFFEPWFYEFTDDIDFIRVYRHCPGCGRKMTSYTGMPMQEGR